MKKKPTKPPMKKAASPMGSKMMNAFESSKFDKDTKKAPEGSKADKAKDKVQMKAFMKKGKK